jgi:hypothetical protein
MICLINNQARYLLLAVISMTLSAVCILNWSFFLANYLLLRQPRASRFDPHVSYT